MTADGLMLCVATFAEASPACSGRALIQRLLDDDPVMAGPLTLHRAPSGNVTVAGPDGEMIHGEALIGENAGLVLGLLAPELLLAGAIDCDAEPTVRRLIRRHEEGRLGAELAEYLTPGQSAVVVLARSGRLDPLCRALTESAKKLDVPVDAADVQALRSVHAGAGRQAGEPHGTQP